MGVESLDSTPISVVGFYYRDSHVKKFIQELAYNADDCYVILCPDDNNKHDANAIGCYVMMNSGEFELVGYLPKEVSAKLSKTSKLHTSDVVWICRLNICRTTTDKITLTVSPLYQVDWTESVFNLFEALSK